MYTLTIPAEINKGIDKVVNDSGRGLNHRDSDFIIRELAEDCGFVCADEWQPFGYGNDERLLIWSDEDAMENDDGQKAIAVAVREIL